MLNIASYFLSSVWLKKYYGEDGSETQGMSQLGGGE